jgi:hypothetical protein
MELLEPNFFCLAELDYARQVDFPVPNGVPFVHAEKCGLANADAICPVICHPFLEVEIDLPLKHLVRTNTGFHHGGMFCSALGSADLCHKLAVVLTPAVEDLIDLVVGEAHCLGHLLDAPTLHPSVAKAIVAHNDAALAKVISGLFVGLDYFFGTDKAIHVTVQIKLKATAIKLLMDIHSEAEHEVITANDVKMGFD